MAYCNECGKDHDGNNTFQCTECDETFKCGQCPAQCHNERIKLKCVCPDCRNKLEMANTPKENVIEETKKELANTIELCGNQYDHKDMFFCKLTKKHCSMVFAVKKCDNYKSVNSCGGDK